MVDSRASEASSARARLSPQRLVEEFGAAWSRKDVDALMSYVADDCVYQASVGPEPGETFRGRAEVRRGIEKMLSHDDTGESRAGRVVMAGNFGISEWSYVFEAEGRTYEVRGCDLFECENGKIKRKDAFRKTFG